MITKTILLIACLSMGIIGCAPQNEKDVTTAEDKIAEAKEELKEAKKDLREERKAERADYWEDREQFKKEYELRIKDNNEKIAEIRSKLDKNDANYARKNQEIGTLEERNRELKRRLDEYNDEQAAARWEEFKREFKNDMDNLGESIKGLFHDDVK